MQRLTFVLFLFLSAPAFAQTTEARLVIGGAGVVQLGGATAESHVMFNAANAGQGGAPANLTVRSVRAVISYAGARVIEVISGQGTCSFDNDTSRLTIEASAPPATEMPTQTLCVVRYSWSGVVTFTEVPGERVFRNLEGAIAPSQITLGSLSEQNSPMSTPPTLTYAPDHNPQVSPDGAIEIAFPPAPQGTLTQRNIAVTAIGGTGGLGSATVSTCLAYRLAGSAITAYIPGFPQFNFGAGSNVTVNFRVECVSRDSPSRALVVCLEGKNPGSLRQRAWDVTCSAFGTPGDLIYRAGFQN